MFYKNSIVTYVFVRPAPPCRLSADIGHIAWAFTLIGRFAFILSILETSLRPFVPFERASCPKWNTFAQCKKGGIKRHFIYVTRDENAHVDPLLPLSNIQ